MPDHGGHVEKGAPQPSHPSPRRLMSPGHGCLALGKADVAPSAWRGADPLEVIWVSLGGSRCLSVWR